MNYILNSEVVDEKTKVIQSVVNFYFLESCGGRFKISYLFRPYLYLETVPGSEFAVAEFLSRKYHFVQVEHVEKENLDLKNHLSGLKSKYLRVSFPSTVEHVQFRRDLFPQIRKNQKAKEKSTEYTTLLAEYMEEGKGDKYADVSPLEQIMDIREYDLPFDMRVCIDGRFFVGHWYTVVGLDLATQKPLIELNPSLVEPPEPIICAFDIETTKAPLKFPDASEDQIMMISYMIDGSGFLIVNRQIISEDIDNFEYTPKPEFVGEFVVFNEENEQKLLLRFFDHLLKIKPSIMVTYNGDFFDWFVFSWPFVDARANFHGININKYLGFYKDSQDEYKHFNCVHMDAFSWVQRDSYLPMGSQSLKAATREKLRYDPIELDPEEMVPMARNQPKVLANYSVSDAVSTYYLYTKYVHPFIFALCTIIPLSPDDVSWGLRKGSGTLCEALLMVQAFHSNIIFPNKQIIKENKMTLDGHLIDSETYVGGHVEAIESGVFRSDIACRFKLDVEALEQLKEEVRPTLEHSLCNDAKILLSEVLNFESICEQIEQSLDALIEKPLRTEHPELYHLDVGAMYPNIILTNRLQPPAIVNEEQCMACIYNAPDAKCKRKMDWVWRGECIPASKGEYDRLMMQLEQERFGKPPKPFNALPKEERIKISKKRITEYCKTAYKRLHDTKIEQRNTTICQREHSFYVDTVRAFRDRRYEYKEMHKKAKASVEAIPSSHLADRKSAQSRVILYDSLQMAHKCILNSFYGYAGIVCHTGANIIREARQLIERIGRPLELDTDGIWCLLPSSFPQNFVFETLNGKKIKISYPAAVLNALVKDRFTNEQYHTIIDDGECIISSENSIFFEVDGPYYAMILPASKEEGKKLKKRYAVFNFDKTLAELKGFEVKRRGELAIIKYFQTEVFKCFLKGSTLEEIYSNVALEANYWLSILYDQGRALSLSELFELIGESKNMSRALEDYGSQKSTSITTAKRLAEFLGEGMVKNRGLACKFIVSRFPIDEPVTERTIPQAIFDSEPNIRSRFLRRWTKCTHLDFADENVFRELIDWQYYIERLNSCIQKIVTIPAALQGLPNPVPKVPHPQWLENKRKERVEMHIQPRITDLFKSIPTNTPRSNKTKSLQSTPWSLKSKKSTTTTNIEQSRKSLFGKEKENKEDDKLLQILNDVDDDIENQPSTSTSLIEKQQISTTTIIQQNEEIIEIDEQEINIVEITQQQPKNKNIKKPEKSKMVKQREAKRLAISQHFFRRLNRADYDLNKQSLVKKTWKENGFSQWLNYLKDLWRFQYLARKREEETLEADNSLANIPSTSTAILGGGPVVKRKHCWQIIQILETKFPGQFTLFALVDDIIRRINLIVPRTVYVDDIEIRQNSIGQLVQKLLPRQRPSANLYEFCIDEAVFSTKMIDLNVQMCLMRINGIYETKIPLMFKTIFHSGVNCNIDGKNVNNELSLEQINKIDNPSIFQFSDFNFSTLPIIYLYEYLHSGRLILSLFMPKFGKAFIFVVNREPVDLLNLNNFYLNELNRFINQKLIKEDEFIGLEQCKKNFFNRNLPKCIN
uniref:DNA polymerase epsilon catalytic subunit n=1 Tax=Meloidogyne enterolobii TaxID=390850 RepID=A0A6V7WV97_MELEN|nr:unnamed protein product [Meloidogyne enterolobii]